MDAVKSLVILEFEKITRGYKFLTELNKSSLDFSEIVPQAPGKLVCLLGGNETDTEEVWKKAKGHGKNIADSYFLKNNCAPILRSLYGQQKPSVQDFFAVVQTKSVSAAVKIADDLITSTKIDLLEIDSGRALNGISLIYFTGNNSEQKQIEKLIKKHKADISVLPKGNPITDRYFQLA